LASLLFFLAFSRFSGVGFLSASFCASSAAFSFSFACSLASSAALACSSNSA